MKKLITFLVLAFVSCNNDDTASTNSVNPNLLQKVIFYQGTSAEKHWNFHNNGLLKEITTANGTLLQTFSYDGNNNLISNIIYEGSDTTTHSFTYDGNNYITSYNGIPISYNAIENSYTKNSVFGNENYTYRYLLNAERLLLKQEYEMVSPDGVENGEGYVCIFSNGNMTGFYDGDAVDGTYQYDEKLNPFKNALLPVLRAFFITGYKFSSISWCIGEFSSNNNVSFNGYDIEGPEESHYIYQYNSNNLPIIQNNNAILYYYQGDIIP